MPANSYGLVGSRMRIDTESACAGVIGAEQHIGTGILNFPASYPFLGGGRV